MIETILKSSRKFYSKVINSIDFLTAAIAIVFIGIGEEAMELDNAVFRDTHQ